MTAPPSPSHSANDTGPKMSPKSTTTAPKYHRLSLVTATADGRLNIASPNTSTGDAKLSAAKASPMSHVTESPSIKPLTPSAAMQRALSSTNPLVRQASKGRVLLHRTTNTVKMIGSSSSDLLVDFKKQPTLNTMTMRQLTMRPGQPSRVHGASVGEGGHSSETQHLDDDNPYMCIPSASNTLFNMWSYLIIACALYDAVTVPYRWAYWIEDTITVDGYVISFIVMDAISDLCSIANMIVAFHTAFHDNGVYITDKHLVRLRYMKSWWFVLDALAVVPLDLIQFIVMAVLPWTRALKILRLVQIVHLIQRMEERGTVNFFARLAKLLFYTLMLAHYTACVKFHAMLQSHHDPMYEILVDESRADFSKYLQMFYWGLGSVTGRDDSAPPESFADSVFTVSMMVIGVLWLAYIIASMEKFSETGETANSRLQAKLKYVTDFMHQFHLPLELQARVKSYYSYLFGSIVKYEDDHFLSKLPVALRTDLRLAYASTVLEKADLFNGVESGFLAHIVHQLSIFVAIPSERICSLNEPANAMYFIQDGEVEILIGPKLAQIATLRTGDYFGEYGLIQSPTARVRTSTARSVTYCTLFRLSYEHLEASMDLFPQSKALVLAKIQEQRKRTNQQEQNLTGDGKSNSKLKKLIAVELDNSRMNDNEALTINPSGRFYRAWFVMTTLATLYNAVVLPLRIGFAWDTTAVAILFFDYLFDVIFVVDIFIHFRLRYLERGEEVRDVDLIRSRYLRSWFALHVLSVVPLDFSMLAYGMVPLFRMNRWLRIVDLHVKILARMRDSTHYELLSLSYLVAVFIVISHFAASTYFAFTRFEGFATSFGEWLPPTELDYNHANVFYQYFFSQYYAMTLLAGIGRHVYPPTAYDVMLSVSLMLIGVFVISYLIGKVGHLMFQLDVAANEFKNEYNYIQAMFEDRKVDSVVQARVNEYLKHVWSSQHGIDPNIALAGLPVPLRTEIMMFICESMIRSVPRFKNLDDSFIRMLVTELRFVELPPGEWIFRQGQLGDSMYFVSTGLAEIIVEPTVGPNGAAVNGRRSSTAEVIKLKVIGAGSFFGEGALLRETVASEPTPTRTASIRAQTKCQLLSLSKESFDRIMTAHPRFARKIRQLNEDRRNKLMSIIKPSSSLVNGANTASTNSNNHNSTVNQLGQQSSQMTGTGLLTGTINEEESSMTRSVSSHVHFSPVITHQHLIPSTSPQTESPHRLSMSVDGASPGRPPQRLSVVTNSLFPVTVTGTGNVANGPHSPSHVNASSILHAMRTDAREEELRPVESRAHPPVHSSHHHVTHSPHGTHNVLSPRPIIAVLSRPPSLPGVANEPEDADDDQ